MRNNTLDTAPKLQFSSRAEFREWLLENSETSCGVWLILGKSKEVLTLSANDALEEALSFGWIDGIMKSIDETQYIKYFARRRPKSAWSDKNKKIIESLRQRGFMTEFGEAAIETAKKNGSWDAPKGNTVTEEQVAAFEEILIPFNKAYENFKNMPKSVRFTYTGRYLSFKTEEARQRDFERIIDRLNNNLKPM